MEALQLELACRPTWGESSSALGFSRRGKGSAWLVWGRCRVVKVASKVGVVR